MWGNIMNITRFEEVTSINNIFSDKSFFKILQNTDNIEVAYGQTKKGSSRLINDNDKTLEKHYLILSGCFKCGDDLGLIKANDIVSFYPHSENCVLKALDNSTFITIIVKKENEYSIHNGTKNNYKLVKQINDKDTYTLDHSRRVHHITKQLCTFLGFSSEDIYYISKAGLYHDLGKIDIPDEILKSTNKLSKEEYEVIKLHSQYGFNHLNNANSEMVANIVYQHHERLDGSGYPLGLKGDEIHPHAQLLSVVDAFDAMTSDRSYKSAQSFEWAIEKLKSLEHEYNIKYVKALEQLLKTGFDINSYEKNTS